MFAEDSTSAPVATGFSSLCGRIIHEYEAGESRSSIIDWYGISELEFILVLIAGGKRPALVGEELRREVRSAFVCGVPAFRMAGLLAVGVADILDWLSPTAGESDA